MLINRFIFNRMNHYVRLSTYFNAFFMSLSVLASGIVGEGFNTMTPLDSDFHAAMLKTYDIAKASTDKKSSLCWLSPLPIPARAALSKESCVRLRSW